MPLFNLPETAQEVFDIVAAHMLKQNQKSKRFIKDSSGYCAYRGDNGLKCAAGCLIPDAIYNRNFENVSWQLLVAFHHFPYNHATLITKLQYIHDNYEPKNWLEHLTHLAACYSLKPDVLNTI